MAALEEQAEKENDASEKKRTQELVSKTEVKKERKRIDSLHSLLDKTAVYSQFVSSQIKAVDANIQGQTQGTGDAAGKRKGGNQTAASSKKKKASPRCMFCCPASTTSDDEFTVEPMCRVRTATQSS